MTNNGRLVGLILISLGLIMFLGGSAVSITSTKGNLGGAVLGIVISVFIGMLPIAAGSYLLRQNRIEAIQRADAIRERRILDIATTRVQVDLRELAIELNADIAQIRNDIYRLIGLGLFTGYVNWDNNTLYSCEVAQLASNKCPNCGGVQEFVGKGVVACKYCGVEVFSKKPA